ncbi:hypothetical protein ABW19_dt0208906 [Dactylella cylindrospora]|nr:hypothetical protein ABW19_dt0208906 [Dactylella cylindrospora]
MQGYNNGYGGGGGVATGGGGGVDGVPHFSTSHVAAAKDKTICGLKRWLFFVLVAAAILVVGGAVGGGVGGSLASRDSGDANSESGTTTTTTSSSTTSTSTASATPTPGTIAAVKDSTVLEDEQYSLTYFFQDINSPDIYMTNDGAFASMNWTQIGKLEGLDPPPKANSSFAAIQAPGEDVISIYYISDNGTLYDANGTYGTTNWQMGELALQTRYSILVSEDSGIAATWWGLEDDSGPGFRRRIYYVDSAAQRVRELAFDANKNPQWFVTDQPLETCLGKAKIAVAHLPPTESSYNRETAHLFYQDRSGNLRHFPGYDGDWDYDNAETIRETTVPEGAYLAASIFVNESANYTLRVWFLDVTSRLSLLTGLGQSLKNAPDFENIGTFDDRELVNDLATSVTISNGETSGGPIAAVGWGSTQEQVRVYYRTNLARNQNINGIYEVAVTGDYEARIIPVEAP